jgi:hypothetical protein
VQGDGTGKKLAKDAEKIFEKMIKVRRHAVEVLARPRPGDGGGLEWQATKVGARAVTSPDPGSRTHPGLYCNRPGGSGPSVLEPSGRL